MGVLSWIILGLIAGLIAKAVMPGRDPGGVIVTMLLGVLGALLGGFIGNAALGTGPVTGVNFRSIILAVLGAVLLLVIYRLVARRRTASART